MKVFTLVYFVCYHSLICYSMKYRDRQCATTYGSIWQHSMYEHRKNTSSAALQNFFSAIFAVLFMVVAKEM